MKDSSSHQDLIRDQFTRQAGVYATGAVINNQEALQLLVQLSGAEAQDHSLDIACGAGQVVCAFAKIVQHATGIDLVPAMIEKARALQAEHQLTNVSWRAGDVNTLPFEDATFTIVTSRYAFHHFPQPHIVLAEMRRVCAAGGRVIVVDAIASPDPVKADAFNRMEKLRDPSHVRAMPLAELEDLVAAHGLPVTQKAFYQMELDVETLLGASFPNPGDAQRVRAMFADSLAGDELGLNTRRVDSAIRFAYPIVVLVSEKTHSS